MPVHQPKQKRDIIEGRPNEVLSLSEVKVVAFKFTDADGFVDMGMAFCFGKDSSDGGPGIWVMNPSAVQEMLQVPIKFVRDGIRQKIAAHVPAAAPEVPDLELGGLELGLDDEVSP